MELQRVADEVLEDGDEEHGIAVDDRQRADVDAARRSRSTRDVEVVVRGLSDVVERDLDERRVVRARRVRSARRSEMRLCMRLAPSTAKPMYWSARSSSWPVVAALQQLAEAGDLAQRLLQVVGGDVGELLELRVGALEVASP